MERVEVRGQTVVDRTLPVDPGQRRPLRVGDRDNRHVAEFAIQRHEVRNVETAVKSSQRTNALSPGQRKVYVLDMKVDDVESMSLAKHKVQHSDVMRVLIDASF